MSRFVGILKVKLVDSKRYLSTSHSRPADSLSYNVVYLYFILAAVQVTGTLPYYSSTLLLEYSTTRVPKSRLVHFLFLFILEFETHEIQNSSKNSNILWHLYILFGNK